MKTKLIFALFLTFIFFKNENAHAQSDTSPSKSERSIIGITPSNVKKVNGLMLYLYPRSLTDTIFPTVNGMELNLNFIGLFTPIVVALYTISPDFHEPPLDNLDGLDFGKFKKINGINIGLFNMDPTIINGLDINTTGSYENKVNGLTCSLIISKNYKINGLTIAPMGNHDTECNGVQIGLFNSAHKLRGFQFGLWNKNEKRSLPFINWNFGKK